ncbi:putative nucleotidyltransferase substrate binding domain-containing protein [Arhodomonas sp. SL1]|uniref:putative nucleotidyltransferase substrate binding domain-containing protein n=1 Tax=Arhodomonas sp. SL1 TaxID=3425691 RepID=UPI003F882CED
MHSVDEQPEAIQRFLEGHTPFDAMEPRHRDLLATHAEVLAFADGEVILEPGNRRVEYLYIVAIGGVEGERPLAEGERFELGAGESFPMGALLGERATRTVYRALGETRCYRVGREVFAQLFTESPPFRDFCIRGVSSLLDQVQRHIQVSAAQNLGAETSFDTPLGELMRGEPVTCGPRTPAREAVARMHGRKVGSIVVVDEAGRPAGIFTLHDLRALVSAGADLDQPVADAMTPEPLGLPEETFAFEAVLLMAREHIRHVVVTRDERLVGVVSERDLFALQRINVVHIMRGISRAGSVEELAESRRGVQPLIDTMMAHGAEVEQLTRIITLLNDRTAMRAIELVREEYGDPGIGFTWLAFGSEGRGEQTLVTDQDNAILFELPPGETAEAVRERLLPLARRINEALAACGFPLCPGNIMASNPGLCLSLDEWRGLFRRIIVSPTPENLLKSSIYFDMRPIWGPPEPAERLFEEVLALTGKNSIFLHMMAGNALQNRPPLGLFRDFITEREAGSRREVLDLKVRGLTPFVDGARLLCLEAGIAEANTLERLRRLAEAGIAGEDEADAWRRSFAFIQLLRMRLHQGQARAGEAMNNRLDPETLNPLDRRILKEAFRQARALQRKLEVRYHV